jgi:hypothetical protein
MTLGIADEISERSLQWEPLFPPGTPDWAKVGQVSAFVFTSLATFAGLVGAIKRRKGYVPLATTGGTMAIVTASAPAPETPPPAATSPEPPFPDCSHEATVRELVTTIADTRDLFLPRHTFRLTSLGNILKKHNVHPFAFIKSAPADKMAQILRRGKGLGFNSVFGGLRANLERHRYTLEPHLPALAHHMQKTDLGRLSRLTQAADWQGLVGYLFGTVP